MNESFEMLGGLVKRLDNMTHYTERLYIYLEKHNDNVNR